MKQILSNKPVKGTSDWLPKEFTIRQYIFDTWRKVNHQFGYEQYLTPIFESADIYRAKSGEDEASQGKIGLKNMRTGKQTIHQRVSTVRLN